MNIYKPPITRRDTAKGHHYRDANGQRVPGVTTILKALPKDALITWAANATADAAINRWDELAAEPPAARLKALQSARREDRDTAANRGIEVHRAAEKLIEGCPVSLPDDIAGHIEACRRFLDDFGFSAEHIEYSVVSYLHGYAGTGDWIATVTIPPTAYVPPSWRHYLGEKVKILGDWKTNRSGIWAETALQDAAYRHADVMLTPGGGEIQMPQVDECAAVHLRTDGRYGFVPLLVTPELYRVFLYLQQVWLWDKDSGECVGAPIELPASSLLRLVREEP